jgi:hypothetical protein
VAGEEDQIKKLMKKSPEVDYIASKAIGTPMTANEIDSTKGVVVSLTTK